MTRPLGRGSKRGHLLLLLAVVWPTVFRSAALATIPPAGQLITSRSLASYDLDGTRCNVFSNEISFSVLPAHGCMVTPDGSPDSPAGEAHAFGGETVAFGFSLRNSGNTDDTYALDLLYPSPADFRPAGAAIFVEAPADSAPETGKIATRSVGPLRPGEEVPVLILATLPGGLSGGELAHIGLVACSKTDGSSCDRDNVVRIVARTEASVAPVLASTETSVLPGDTIGFTIRFSNTGERAATGVALSDYIDLNGLCEGARYVPGSAALAIPGRIEFYDAASSSWSDLEPPAERVKGVRFLLASLEAGAGGAGEFRVRVTDDRAEGDLHNAALAEFAGGDARVRHVESNRTTVHVGRVSSVAIGPRGNPAAPAGGPEDRVVTTLNGNDASYTLWHEILNQGNFADSFRVAVVDSAAIPDEWRVDFVDSVGSPLDRDGRYSALVGTVSRGGHSVVGLRLRSTPEGFRRFAGRELRFDVSASSLFFEQSSDRVQDVLVKADVPIVSITQSIREPSALIGDVLSFIVMVENLTEETALDSVLITENLCPGLGYAEGSLAARVSGNLVEWNLGGLAPGGRREIVFRARVKAGQETGKLVSSAWAHAVTETGERVSDGPAQASVLIVEGIFTRRGIISGGVFADRDGNGSWDVGERGVFGVSVFVEDGTFAVTDSLGRYSIPGVVEGRHVVRIDPLSLPDSLAPGSVGYFGFGEPGEALIDLAPSGHRRIDFPLVGARGAAAGGPGAVPSPPVPSVAGASPDSGQASSGAAALPPADESHGGEARIPEAAFEAITIPSMHFAPGKAEIAAIPLEQVVSLSLWIKDHPGWTVFIEGHTDSLPISGSSFPSNLELSIARARSMFQILRMSGIAEDRMDFAGYGARMPVASNSSEEGRALNRRVEIRVVPPDDYGAGDPELPRILRASEEAAYPLADSAGVCASIVKPDEGEIFFSRSEIEVEIVSPLGSDVELYVNNLPVGNERIGLKRIDTGSGTFGSIFYGVKLQEGRNDILVVCREYGGKRSTCVRHVYLAGLPRLIVPEHETVRAPADGKTRPELVFLVSDGSGLPVRDGIFITVIGPRDLIEALDANPQQPGVQATTSNGRVILRLPPSRESRREAVHVALEGIEAGCRISYEAPHRGWFLLGYGEGALGYGDLTGSGSTLRLLEPQRDGTFAEGKIAFYGQGEVRPGHLLTCAVDTRPLRDDMLFRRIEPDKYYPIYGDASDLKFNTASRSGTFLRLDNRRYEAMFGDFKTALGRGEFTRYDRSFNGLSGEARFAQADVRGFITRTDQITYQEELRAEGTSGFYFVHHYPLVEHSERIRIEVRDRYRSERIVRVDYKQANRDYDINYLDGSILFKEPIPVFDENLNPVTIVVSYECRNSGENNFVYGVRSAIAVRDSLVFGTTAVLEEEGVENSTLLGLDLTGQVRPGLHVESEFAYSEKFLLGGGNAFRALIGGEQRRAITWSAYYRDVGEDFFNPSFSGGKTELGSRKLGGDLTWRINQAFGISTQGYRHSLRERDEKKDYADLVGHYTDGAFAGQIGVAGAGHSDARVGESSAMLLRTGLGLKGSSTQGEIEWDQIIAGGNVEEYPNRIQARLARRLWRNISGTVKHEYRTDTRSGTRHQTQLGVESPITEHLTAYSRYQLEGAMGGERGQATIGIKNRFMFSDDLTSTVTAEKLATVSGDRDEDYLSLSTSALYTPRAGDYRLKGNYEIRLEPERRKHLAELAALKRLSEQWAFLVKGDLWFSDEKREGDHVKGSSTIGLSVRPREGGPLTLLSLVKSQYEKDSPAHPGAVDREILSSLEADYRPNLTWELEGKLAARWISNSFRGLAADASAFMYQTQIVRTIAEKWDAGLTGRLVYQKETRTLSYGGGIEVGRLAAHDLWVGAGYDFGGHDDREESINSFARNGFHVGIRLKFDEKIMSYFYGDRRIDE